MASRDRTPLVLAESRAAGVTPTMTAVSVLPIDRSVVGLSPHSSVSSIYFWVSS